MLWKKTAKRSVKTSDLTAFIDEGSEIEGKYTFSGTVMLNGKFRGEIASTDTLIIGEKGIVHATIRAGVVLISGQVVGNLVATERVELRGTARVFGDVEAPVVVVEEGVLFEGHCRMTQAPSVLETAPAAATFPMAAPAQPRDLSVVSLKR
jgi:cytoskeletal protein CcmA (bactofilin family)